MNRKVQTVSFKSAMPGLALGAVLMLLGPTAALAQRGSGERGGHSGGSSSGRSLSGGGERRYSAPSYSGRSYSGGGRSYATPYSGRDFTLDNSACVHVLSICNGTILFTVTVQKGTV